MGHGSGRGPHSARPRGGPLIETHPEIFSDRGAWHGYRFDDDALLVVVPFDGEGESEIRATAPVAARRIRDDRMEAELADGTRVVLRYADARTAEIEVEGGADLTGAERVTPGRFRHVHEAGPAGPGEDLAGLPATLRRNWRVPHRDVRHGGAVPSPHAYPGFWAWDSWKHAAALPTRLARQQILAMLDHQREDGMVPDTVMADARENNWRNSKPPLAVWACSKHPGLVDEFRPELTRCLSWWEDSRRPPGERLLAYGGDDAVAARWESGWDNATRYDDLEMRDGLMSVLSVDLNAYWCRERRLLGEPAPDMEALVNETFFVDGAYRDVTWPDHRPVETLTAATWTPLWCGIADGPRARAVIDLLLDPAQFDTPLPFPSVARSDPKFDPSGYWRGSVWMDHAAWAVEALIRYGRERQARERARRLLEAPPDWECYDPLTGGPARGDRPAVPQFSWTAAARLYLESMARR